MATNNNIFQRIWNAFFPPTAEPEGRMRSYSYLTTVDDTNYLGRNYDLELSENPVRDPENARKLIELVEYCPEIGLAMVRVKNACWSSIDGDNNGFKIGDCIDADNEIPIDPEIQKILQRLIDEVIGGLALDPVPEDLYCYGDSFASLGIDVKAREIRSILFLPKWEMFRVEDNAGRLLAFEQRRFLTDSDAIQFHPLRIVHWRHNRKSLYGRPFYNKGIEEDWVSLREATKDLAGASRAVGANPNKHIMPCGYDLDYKLDYKNAYELAKKQGQVLDFYLDNGADVAKVSETNPDLSSMIANVLFWRQRVAMATGLPSWMFNLQDGKGLDIGGQPALTYSMQINSLRQCIVEGIKEICDLELALHGIDRMRWKYRIEFPPIKTDPYHETAAERQASAQQSDPNQPATT